ncbi:MAG: excinuclease ABC subunit UvrC [Deltaproteobacteria bacterium]|nr:excinuclease ABC subunit UvrC [Deltaproteobacteria bacterium]MBW1994473.1 excinuclease ABC subunit UvrC [Deltaproteobacteria bacterium]MBW2152811.1 excinuclease ABC subunit UvrC [Deltaproteobacteria bacterium]
MLNDLATKIERVPSGPGVYLMRDSEGRVIYIGKARDLKKRLSSYFRNAKQWNMKTAILVQKASSFDTIITSTEKEALILESNLIKRHKPRYNVVLKDDKRYPSLRLDINSPYPNLTIVRKPKKDGALYFGPYASAKAVRETLNIVNKAFKLRKCKTNDFRNRTRPCLHCQMQRCLAPCCMDVDPSDYDEMVREAILFLKGRTPDLIRKIKKEMEIASEKQEFEKAARLRDKMFALQTTVEKQVAVTTDFRDRDVLAVATRDERSLVTIFAVRGGYLMGTRHFDVSGSILSESEVIDTFIRQYYESAPFIPEEILIPTDIENNELIEEWLRQLKGSVVRVHHPRKGEKARLILLAKENAEKELNDQIAVDSTEANILARLQQRLRLERYPQRIECFDNSNISGTEPVAAMVVFETGKPKRADYRKYRIKSVDRHDDYAYMAEVLKRRFSKGKQSLPHPDLLVVDGGKGQLNIAVSVLKELGNLGGFDLIGIAKKDERRGETEDKVYKAGRANPVNFGKDRDLLLFLQKIRDEAHRFAISFHRQRRRKRSLHSALDSVPGIGKKRKEILLKHFGSMKKIREAHLEEILSLPGMNRKIAQAIKAGLATNILEI